MQKALLVVFAAILIVGCAKQQAAVQATPSATVAATTTPGEGASESPQPAESVTPSPTPTPTPVPNLLAQSAIVRAWPPTAADNSPAALLNDEQWQSAPGATGTLIFVFELAAPASVGQFVLSPSSTPATDPQKVRVEGSLSGADTGYSDIGTFTIDSTGNVTTFPVEPPAHARWLRVSFEQRGTTGTTLHQFEAHGVLDAIAPAKPMAGTWLLDQWTKMPKATDAMWKLPGRLPQSFDWKAFKDSHSLLKVIALGNEFRALECIDLGTSGIGYSGTQALTQDGATVLWQSIGERMTFGPGTLNVEGNVLAGSGYMALRLSDAVKCNPPAPPKGHGKPVLVLAPGGDPTTFSPYDDPETYPGFRFIPQYVGLFEPSQLAGMDSVILLNVCDGSTIFAKAQASALLEFVASGHKLIIRDADSCTQSGYAFMPYPFTTNNPGAKGNHGNNLVLVESSELGSGDRGDRAHFIDASAYAKHQWNQLGDANTVISQDSHWCGHLFGTNSNGVNGFMEMFAPYGRGLLIYNGFDVDDWRVPDYRKLVKLELSHPVPYNPPCTQPVSSSFLVSPSTNRQLASGTASRQKFDLMVLANQGYAGSVSLVAKAPAEAPWVTTLSKSQVELKGDTKPLTFSIDVPADARPGSYSFLVKGIDAKGQSAQATITLTVANPPPKKIERALEKSKRIAIYGIHFDFNSATVRKESQPVIRDIADILKQHADWKLTIEGHTDNVGGAAYNLDLSKRRAEAVRSILVTRYAIAAARLSSAGYGFTHPKASNATEAGRAENRRVELVRR
ncbi:MAG TPA: OmpA family protein [Candidatus Tumulicola sp.]|nr:OmpA family protein [Candidatus Tumulicola sp.]